MGTKQVIVLRKDLNMRKGKMVAQGAHASLKVFFDKIVNREVAAGRKNFVISDITHPMELWAAGSFTKICVGVNSEAELLAVYEKARNLGIPCSLVRDAGLTEFKEPTYTAVAVGPDYNEKVDLVTSTLTLL